MDNKSNLQFAPCSVHNHNFKRGDGSCYMCSLPVSKNKLSSKNSLINVSVPANTESLDERISAFCPNCGCIC